MQNSNYSLYYLRPTIVCELSMIIRGIKKVVKPFVDFPKWMGLKDVKVNASMLFSNVKAIFTYNKTNRTETFENAVVRLGLTEKDLVERSQQYKYTAMVYLGLALVTLAYAVFLLIGQHYLGGLPAACIAMLFLVFAFRNHFWFFQIRRRKLGCTVKEWFNYIIGK
ncbi:MAG: icmV [Gammaproteobacteria bacterium]|nr:icmV [Gammaproteobacteria bacterium]